MPRLLEMGKQFHDSVQPQWPWDRKGFMNVMGNMIDMHFVRITDGGFIAGMLAPHPLSPSWHVAHEVLWWAQDKAGPRLANAFRAWAKEQGADEIEWSCRSTNERVKRFYSKFSTPTTAVFSEVTQCALQQSQQ